MHTLLTRDGFRPALNLVEPDHPQWGTLWGGWLTLRLIDRWLTRPGAVTQPHQVREVLTLAKTQVEALPILDRVLTSLQDSKPEGRAVANALLDYARLWRGQAAWGLALDVIDRVVRTAGLHGELDVVAQAQTLAGFCRRQRGEWQEAEQAYGEALAAGEASGDLRVWLEARVSEAYLHVDRGDLSTGQARLESALVDAVAGDDAHSEGRISHGLMLLEVLLGRSNRAVGYGHRALQVLVEPRTRERVLLDFAYALELSGQGRGADIARRQALRSPQADVREIAAQHLVRRAALSGDVATIDTLWPTVAPDPHKPAETNDRLLAAAVAAARGQQGEALQLLQDAEALLERDVRRAQLLPMAAEVGAFVRGRLGLQTDDEPADDPMVAEALAWLAMQPEAAA